MRHNGGWTETGTATPTMTAVAFRGASLRDRIMVNPKSTTINTNNIPGVIDEESLYEAPHSVDLSSVDKMLSKELLQLSLRDRNAVDEEIHGVSTLAPKETPELLALSLLELSGELDKIPDEQKESYLESQRCGIETHVNTSDFRLRFLRCELFDAPKAAIRLVKFLDLSSELFGPQVLRRPLRLTDFPKGEEKLVKAGNLQVFPYRDRSGRPIYARVGDWGFSHGTVRFRTRLNLYLLYALSDDAESQRKGVTKVGWVGRHNEHPTRLPQRENASYYRRLGEAAPIRTAVTHYCAPDKPYYHLHRAMHALTLSKANQARLKFHIGEDVELLYKLQTYGIPVELLPVTSSGTLKTAYLKQWIKARKAVEVAPPTTGSVVVLPLSTDVLFRAGSNLAFHPGNSTLQDLIASQWQKHGEASQDAKRDITRGIIATLTETHRGRFLQWNGGHWTELKDPGQIHTKVAASVKGYKFKPHVVAASTTKKHRLAPSRETLLESSTLVFSNQQDLGWSSIVSKRRKLVRDPIDSDTSSCGDSCCFF